MKLKTGEKVHDYTNMFWGWSIMGSYKQNDKYYVSGIGKGIKEGSYLMFLQDGKENRFGYKLGPIEYKSNPPDMYTAEIVQRVEFEDSDFTQTSK